MRRSFFHGSVVFSVLICAPWSALAQDVIEFRPSRWVSFDPVDDISSRIFAQSELVRAQGEAAVDIGLARVLHAKAVDQELDNWKKHVEVYWDRKIIRDQKQLELDQLRQIRNQRYLNRRKAANRQVWDRLANHPELTATSGIPQGTALNFLLRRLSTQALVYEFVNEQPYDLDVFDQVRLSPEVVHALQLRQLMSGGTKIVFRPDEAQALRLEQWPYLLRSEQLRTARERFESVRDEAARQAKNDQGELSNEVLLRLEEQLGRLTRAFFATYRWEDWSKRNFEKRSQYRTADAFLRNLMREVTRLQDTGNMQILPLGAYDATRDGDNLVALLTYMTRNGLEFAPAAAGDEAAYNQVFHMMRDLYLLVGAQDPGTQPKDLTREID